MVPLLSTSWWVLAVRGVAALLFGVLALMWPKISLLVFIAMFAAYALVSGVVEIIGALRHRTDKGWWAVLLLGIASVIAGLIAVVNPGLTLVVLVLLIAAHAVVTGIFDIIAAIRLRKEIEREWLLALTGAISVLFGVLVFVFPPVGALALAYMMGFYALLAGILLLTLAFRARKWPQRPGAPADLSTRPEQPRPT